MKHITHTRIYQLLSSIYGEEALIVHKSPENRVEESHYYIPVKEEMETVGWIGIQRSLLREDSISLIEMIAGQSASLMTEEHTPAHAFWRRIIQEDMANWVSDWQQLPYESNMDFGNVYMHIDQPIHTLDRDIAHTLQEMVEGVLEGESYFIHIYETDFVWIIPNISHWYRNLSGMLHGLLDTIVSECIIDIRFLVGQPYHMPKEFRPFIKEELRYLQLAIHYDWESPVVHMQDLVQLVLLDHCPTAELYRLIDTVLGSVQEDEELLQTIDQFLDENMNVSETAKKLYIHRNSMQYRLDKFLEKTGLDVRRFDDAARVYLALKALGIIHKKK